MNLRPHDRKKILAHPNFRVGSKDQGERIQQVLQMRTGNCLPVEEMNLPSPNPRTAKIER